MDVLQDNFVKKENTKVKFGRERDSRLQSLPMLGSGQRQRCCGSQMALPGQSLLVLQVTIVTQRVVGSGSGSEPSGH